MNIVKQCLNIKAEMYFKNAVLAVHLTEAWCRRCSKLMLKI